MVTIYDIAKKCNCSSATVSKVLSRTGSISEKKRNEVLDAARSLGYVPNVTARNLVKKRSDMVGVLLFSDKVLGLRHELFAEILNSFRTVMEEKNYEIVLISEKATQWDGSFLTHCRALRLDGLFCLCCEYGTSAVRDLFESDMPIVGFESPFAEKSSVASKNFEAGKRLTEYLIGLGHRRIAFLAGKDTAITRERIAGYRAALAEYSVPFDDALLIRTNYFSSDSGENATHSLLSCGHSFTAAMYPDDFTALAATYLLAQHGLYVGKNISVTGFDGISVGSLVTPRLTTMRQNAQAIGAAAAQSLINQIEGRENPQFTVSLDTTLVEGESTAAL